MANITKFSVQWGDKELTIETGRLALQSGGSVTVSCGGTVVLASATISGDMREGLDFFPLTVEFEERLYAAGKIKGSRFIKREGRPSDEAVLTGRMIDRALRPLFDERIRNEVQVICTTIAYDPAVPFDVIGLIAASAALHISNVPWNGPIAGLRIGLSEGSYVLNPAFEQIAKSRLDLVVAGSADKVIMVECGANEVNEEEMLGAFDFANQHYGPVIEVIEKVRQAAGKEKKTLSELMPHKTEDQLIKEESTVTICREIIKDITGPWLLTNELPTKALRKNNLAELKAELKAKLHQRLIDQGMSEIETDGLVKYISGRASKLIELEISLAIVDRERRVDGRAMDEIRALSAEVNIFDRLHGSALFQRGETQVLSIVTLGAPGDAQIIDGMEVEEKKRYMHHYNFPPYSVGEVKMMRGTGRREIGHGALAEKALVPVLPAMEDFPYTIRVVSEVLGSNGSSSMGSTCGSSLALMAAGVPIKKPVAGIAIGLVSFEDKNIYKVITDLQDLEDGLGGMDFKIAGTVDGITAIQLDTKTSGLPRHVVIDALKQGKKARLEILDVMNKAISVPAEMSQYAPRILTLTIHPDKIREVIGSGGKVINDIIAKTGAQIDIEDSGLVMITGAMEGALAAKKIIEGIVKVPEVGEIFEGPIVKLMDFGAFVKLTPGKDGLVHVSEIDWARIEKPSDVLKEGQVVQVKVLSVDSVSGKVSLSMKALKPRPEPTPTPAKQ